MHIVEQTKFLIGIVFAIVGIGVLISSWRQRGFGRRRQTGVMLLIAAAAFISVGLGYHPRALLGQ